MGVQYGRESLLHFWCPNLKDKRKIANYGQKRKKEVSRAIFEKLMPSFYYYRCNS